MSTRRRTNGMIPRALDPVRARRASQQAAAGQTVGPGQLVDPSGRIVPHLGDVMFLDRTGAQQIRIDEASLQVVTSSPKRIAARTKPADVEAVAVEAASATEELDARTEAAIVTLIAEDVAIDGRLTALEAAPPAHGHDGGDITTGVIDPNRLGTGAGGATKFLREDGTWAAPSGGGSANATSVDVPLAGTDASVVVTGLAWASSAAKFAVSVLAGTGMDPMEPLLQEVRASIGDIVDGVGFTVYGYAPTGAFGTFKVHVVQV